MPLPGKGEWRLLRRLLVDSKRLLGVNILARVKADMLLVVLFI